MASRLTELAALFLKLGAIGFGGPAVHIAVMEDEVVERRGWMTRQHFLDLVGATNLIPGPNSTEMAIHIGFTRAGFAGLVVAGVSFILPAALITMTLAFVYVQFGKTPQLEQVLYGIKPAVLAIIFTAGARFVSKAIHGWDMAVLMVAVAVAKLAGVGEVTSLLAGALAGVMWLVWRQRRPGGGEGTPTAVAGISGLIALGRPRLSWFRRGPWLLAAAGAPAAPTLLGLGLFFLKVGCVLYGTGYVLLAYLEGGLVNQYQWLEMDQLVEAVAIGQLTPGPILSTATFIGYVVMANQGGHALGVAGALVSTVCIFLPAFLLVAAINPLVPRLRKSRFTAAFLDAVNAASLGLMAAVAIRLAVLILLPGWQLDYEHMLASVLGISKQLDYGSLLIAALAMAVAFRWNPRPAWIVIGGAAAGWAVTWLL